MFSRLAQKKVGTGLATDQGKEALRLDLSLRWIPLAAGRWRMAVQVARIPLENPCWFNRQGVRNGVTPRKAIPDGLGFSGIPLRFIPGTRHSLLSTSKNRTGILRNPRLQLPQPASAEKCLVRVSKSKTRIGARSRFVCETDVTRDPSKGRVISMIR